MFLLQTGFIALCSNSIKQLPIIEQEKVYILDSLISVVILSNNYVEVCDWFENVNLDSVESIVLVYHEG